MKIKINLIIIAIWLACFNFSAYAQSETPALSKTETSVVSTLTAFIQSMEDINAEIKNKEKEYKSADSEERQTKIKEELSSLRQKLEDYEKDFERIATNVDWEELDTGEQQDFDWQKEIRDIFRPVINGLKKITERPMQIEKLRSEAEFHEKRLAALKDALENIQNIIPQSQDETLNRRLKALEKKWKKEERQISNQLTVTRHHLEEKLKQKTSVWQSAQNILQLFFKSRGRNLILSVLAFIAVFFLLRLIYRLIRKIIPAYKAEIRPFYLRLFEAAYHVLTYIVSACALLAVLYVFNDWILLSFVIIFGIGIAWAAKQGIFQFWEQTKILLNIGSVRDNERIIYNGIPWKIASLSIYSQLENPCLTVPRIRIPLKELIGQVSRPYHKDEPWFPCEADDWVILSDGTFGKVGIQTQEFVQLFCGAMPKTYLTQDFLGLTPGNLSKGFFLTSTFGIDYDHQDICTKEVPEKMQQMLTERLAQEGFEDDLTDLSVQFKEAGASSLDLMIIASFTGNAAPFYGKLGRLLQQIALETATQYGWGVPFPQITYSYRDASESD